MGGGVGGKRHMGGGVGGKRPNTVIWGRGLILLKNPSYDIEQSLISVA